MREILADSHGFATAMFDVQSRLLSGRHDAVRDKAKRRQRPYAASG